MKTGPKKISAYKQKDEIIDLETRILLYLDDRPRGSAKRAKILKGVGFGISMPELNEILEEMETLGLLNLVRTSGYSTDIMVDSVVITDWGSKVIN